jgi:glycogen debranching enzyme
MTLVAVTCAGPLWRQRSSEAAIPYRDGVGEAVQVLTWGDLRQERPAPSSTMFATTGRRLYVIGDVDGGFRPRSNPYDLYDSGAPNPADPLANELQGVWAQPVKAVDGYVFVVEMNGTPWSLLDAERFTQTFADVSFEFHRDGLRATRRDFVPQDLPVLFTSLTLTNTDTEAADVRLTWQVHFDLEDASFTSLADKRNRGERVEVEAERIVARAKVAPGAWAVAAGAAQRPDEVHVTQGPDGQQVGQFGIAIHLEPGETQSRTFAIVVEQESGVGAALAHLDEWLPQYEQLLAQKHQFYDALWANGPHLHSPDAQMDLAFAVARANMQQLEAESSALGQHFYAGLEMFAFWFSNDGYYSLPGLLASNLTAPALDHVLIGSRFDENGRIPHQISPAGKVAIPGNAQEAPQWVMSVWDAYRWTGNREFLEAAYPTAVEALFTFALDNADRDGDLYPEGPAMVEKPDMGVEKVDSACYLWSALVELAQIAELLGDLDTAARAGEIAADLKARFDADWWLPEEAVYANSLQGSANTPRHDGHWTIAVPLEVGIAPPARAQATLDRIGLDHVNEWGLVHTLGDDDRVWTLPTVTLSRGAYRYGDAELGLDMLRHVAETLDHGSIGAFHELIPDGLSFLQLWSAAAFVRGVVEDLLGIQVRADLHAIEIVPQLITSWNFAELEDLRFGGHTITVRATPTGATVTHTQGPAPLSITYRSADSTVTDFVLKPGETFSVGE